MKMIRKLASIALALIMLFAMAAPAMAAEITVENAAADETYTAYKIFDVTNSGTSYSYTMSSTSLWKDVIEGYAYNSEKVFTLTPSATDSNVLVVTVSEAFSALTDAADLANYLSTRIPTSAEKTSVTATSSKVAKFTNLDAGYYFVDTTLGSLCSLFTTDDDAKLIEKNTIPILTKTADKDTLAIGDTINYTITVTDTKGTDQAITVHDKMETGLTLNADSITIKDGNSNVIATSNYTLKTSGLNDGCTFEIEFIAAYVKQMQENEKIIITYSAVLNENAEIHTETNDNTAWLEYSQQITQNQTVEASTFKFDVDKTDSNNNPLTGATFKLYDAATGGNEVAVVKVSDGQYRVAKDGEFGVIIETDAKGQFTVKGLDAKVYWLEEITAPSGFNPLTARVKVDLSGKTNLVRTVDGTGKIITYGVQVVNNAGTQLPETGGVGTTIFYIAGGVLVLAAVVLLVTRKRMSREG